MDDIAARAGVGVGTVYRHFETKDALFEALLLDRIAEARASARQAAAAPDPWEGFASVLRNAAEMQARDRGFQGLIAAGAAQSGAVRDAMAGLHGEVARIMRQAQEAGELRADVSLDDVPSLMCGIARVVGSSDRASWERYVGIMLDGLRAGRATRLAGAA